MANKVSIEEQVAQLSQEQQDKVIKVGKISLIVMLAGIIPWLIGVILGIATIINPPADLSVARFDGLFIGLLGWLAIGAVYVIGILAFVKIKYPYYSDAKWRYINQMRTGK